MHDAGERRALLEDAQLLSGSVLGDELGHPLEGIAAAKARGVYTGRRAHIDPAVVRQLREQEKLGASAIAERLGIGRASVYRLLGKVAA